MWGPVAKVPNPHCLLALQGLCRPQRWRRWGRGWCNVDLILQSQPIKSRTFQATGLYFRPAESESLQRPPAAVFFKYPRWLWPLAREEDFYPKGSGDLLPPPIAHLSECSESRLRLSASSFLRLAPSACLRAFALTLLPTASSPFPLPPFLSQFTQGLSSKVTLSKRSSDQSVCKSNPTNSPLSLSFSSQHYHQPIHLFIYVYVYCLFVPNKKM